MPGSMKIRPMPVTQCPACNTLAHVSIAACRHGRGVRPCTWPCPQHQQGRCTRGSGCALTCVGGGLVLEHIALHWQQVIHQRLIREVVDHRGHRVHRPGQQQGVDGQGGSNSTRSLRGRTMHATAQRSTGAVLGCQVHSIEPMHTDAWKAASRCCCAAPVQHQQVAALPGGQLAAALQLHELGGQLGGDALRQLRA